MGQDVDMEKYLLGELKKGEHYRDRVARSSIKTLGEFPAMRTTEQISFELACEHLCGKDLENFLEYVERYFEELIELVSSRFKFESGLEASRRIANYRLATGLSLDEVRDKIRSIINKKPRSAEFVFMVKSRMLPEDLGLLEYLTAFSLDLDKHEFEAAKVLVINKLVTTSDASILMHEKLVDWIDQYSSLQTCNDLKAVEKKNELYRGITLLVAFFSMDLNKCVANMVDCGFDVYCLLNDSNLKISMLTRTEKLAAWTFLVNAFSHGSGADYVELDSVIRKFGFSASNIVAEVKSRGARVNVVLHMCFSEVNFPSSR